MVMNSYLDPRTAALSALSRMTTLRAYSEFLKGVTMVKMPHWPIPMGSKPIDLGLNRIKILLQALGDPQNKLFTFGYHVTGSLKKPKVVRTQVTEQIVKNVNATVGN